MLCVILRTTASPPSLFGLLLSSSAAPLFLWVFTDLWDLIVDTTYFLYLALLQPPLSAALHAMQRRAWCTSRTMQRVMLFMLEFALAPSPTWRVFCSTYAKQLM
jgi:hypothetical protein